MLLGPVQQSPGGRHAMTHRSFNVTVHLKNRETFICQDKRTAQDKHCKIFITFHNHNLKKKNAEKSSLKLLAEANVRQPSGSFHMFPLGSEQSFNGWISTNDISMILITLTKLFDGYNIVLYVITSQCHVLYIITISLA